MKEKIQGFGISPNHTIKKKFLFCRFAEELMKTECKVPELQLLDSTNVSMSGSSMSSFHSSKSGFKDPLLSSFEGELLSSGYGRSSTRGSLKRKSRSGSLKRKNLLSESSDTGNVNRSAKVWTDARVPALDGDALSWQSKLSAVEEVAVFAEKLAQKVLVESLHSVFPFIALPSQTTTSTLPKTKQMSSITEYAENIASTIVTEALTLIGNNASKRKHMTDADDRDSRHSSGEFWDAMPVPFKDVEEYAERIALNVLQTSINVIHREFKTSRKV